MSEMLASTTLKGAGFGFVAADAVMVMRRRAKVAALFMDVEFILTVSEASQVRISGGAAILVP
jgi:adenylylsulfate kinase-like enzyme